MSPNWLAGKGKTLLNRVFVWNSTQTVPGFIRRFRRLSAASALAQ